MAELDKFKRRVIRSVARMQLAEKKPEHEQWQELKKETGCDCQKLWERMRGLTIKKLKRLLAADDKVDNIIPIAKMSLTDWLLFDLVLVHDDVDVIGEYVPSTSGVKPLEELFDIVDEFEIEGKVGEALADAWTAATFAYNKMGRQCSPMLLQRRWYQLKRKARMSFYKFWYNYRGNLKLLQNAKNLMPNKLQMAIAQRYPHIVTKPFLEWNQLIENRSVILPEEFDKKINPSSRLSKLRTESEPDIVLLEPNIETIDLGDADSDSDKAEEDSDVAKKPGDLTAESQTPIKEVVVKTEPPDDIESYSESLEDSLKEINKRLLDSIPNIDDEEGYFNMETDDLVETNIGGDGVGATSENVTTDSDANIVDDITNDDDIDDDEEPATNVEQISENDNENKTSEMATEDDIDVVKTENTITVDHTESDVHENVNTEDDVLKQLKQDISSEVNDMILETGARDSPPLDEPMVMPQITSVFGNVNVETDVLMKMSKISRESKEGNQSPNRVLASVVVNAPCEPIDVDDDTDDEVNERLKAFLNSDKETEPKEIEPVDTNTAQQNSTPPETPETIDSKAFLDMSADLTFADNGIELVDDGIEYEEDDDDDIIKHIGESDIKKEEETANKSETHIEEENPKFDLKLLMQPVVYTTKLEDMNVFRDINVDCVRDINLLNNALIESKPVSKTQHDLDKQNLEMFDTSINLTSEGEKKSDDSEDEMSEPEQLSIGKRIKLSSNLLQKPKSRSYNPIQLCRNPDFNTRLKRLTACFLSSMRNRSFLKTLKPMTIDLSKAFESKLIGGTLYLEPESKDSTLVIQEVEDNSEQATSILPSAMPAQSLIDNLIVKNMFPSATSGHNALPSGRRDSTALPERSKVVNLPDIENIRRMNQRLFTAEVTPMRIRGPNEKCVPPVQLVKLLTEDDQRNQATATTLPFAVGMSSVPMHTGNVNKTPLGEKSSINKESVKRKPGPKSRCNINFENITTHQVSSTYSQRLPGVHNAEPIAKKRRVVDNAHMQYSVPERGNSINNTRTTEKTNKRYIPGWMQIERQKPGPKRDDINKIKKPSYYPSFNRKECSTISWLNKSYSAQETPRAHEALLTVDTLNKMLSLIENKEPSVQVSKKMQSEERRKFVQRQTELDDRLDEYEKRKLGIPVVKAKSDLHDNEKSEKNESATTSKKNKNYDPTNDEDISTSPTPTRKKCMWSLSFCCWARSKIEYPKNKRRHRCPRICECCCRNEFLVKASWKNPSSVVISDDEDNQSDNIDEAIESVVQNSGDINETSENAETPNALPKDLNSDVSIAEVTPKSQQVEASIQCDLDDNNLASQTSIQTDLNNTGSPVEVTKLSETTPSVSTDVIAIDNKKDPKPSFKINILPPARPIVGKKPRISILPQSALRSPSNQVKKSSGPLVKIKRQDTNYLLNFTNGLGRNRKEKVVHIKSKQHIEGETGCPIFLGKNKILLTDVKLPRELSTTLSATKVPVVELAPAAKPLAFELPEGVSLRLLPDGKLNCTVDPMAQIPIEILQTLPDIIAAIQQQFEASSARNNSSEVVNLTDDDLEENFSVINVDSLSEDPASIVRQDNEDATNDIQNITQSIQNNATLECNEVLINNDIDNIQSNSDMINTQSLNTPQDNEELNPNPSESSINCVNMEAKTPENSNKPNASQTIEESKTTSEINSKDCVDSGMKTPEQSYEPSVSQTIEESETTSEINSKDCVDSGTKTPEQSNEPSVSQTIEESETISDINCKDYVDTLLKASEQISEPATSQAVEELEKTSEINSIDCVDTLPKASEQSSEPATSQAVEELEKTSEINSIDCVDAIPKTTEQSNEPTTSQAIEETKTTSEINSKDCVDTVLNTVEQSNDTIENGYVQMSPLQEVDIVDNQEAKIDNTAPNKNRSSLLSDLMAMSGISAEDVTVPLNESPPRTRQVPASLPIDQQLSPRYLQTAVNTTPVITSSPNKSMKELSSIISFQQLKYACDNNGKFYKLDLDTGILSPINVCIKKNHSTEQTSLETKTIIDLTDDTALPEDQSNLVRLEHRTLPENHAVSEMRKVRKHHSFPSDEPKAFVIMKSDQSKSLLKDSFHLSNYAKPIKLFKSANILKHNLKNKVTDSHAQDQNSTAKKLGKQMINNVITLDDESLGTNDSFDSIDDYIWNTEGLDKSASDSESSDDEPLALKAKRMRSLETKESLVDASNEITKQNVDESLNTTDENDAHPEENIEDQEMARVITFMSDHEADNGNEDCILGF